MIWRSSAESRSTDDADIALRRRRYRRETGEDGLIDILVKYHGSITRVARILQVDFEIMRQGFAILGMTAEKIGELIGFEEIESYEHPQEITFLSDFSASCIRQVQRPDGLGLTGEGVIVGVIDSGLDYSLDDFRNSDGTSRILYFWDQEDDTDDAAPSEFGYGREYTKADFDAALQADDPFDIIPQLDSNGHGTAVAAIAAGNRENIGVATMADIIAVKLAPSVQQGITHSTQIMRAVKYIVDKGVELSKPVVINISFGTNNGPHSGESLFERYLDEMSNIGQTVLVAAAGNEASAAHHYRGNLQPNTTQRVDFFVSGSWFFYLSLWKSFADNFSVDIILPDNRRTGSVCSYDGRREFNIEGTLISIEYRQPTSYSDDSEVYIQAYSENGNLPQGVWGLEITTEQVTDGEFNIWLPITEAVGRVTRFTNPDSDTTAVIPSTAGSVISVGGYDTATDGIAFFSGRGYTRKDVYLKPDLVAPAVGVTSTRVGGGTDSFTGTSFAAPFVAGSAALMMQWGIVQGNDHYLFGQRVKAFLIAGANRPRGEEIPNNSFGYGTLCLKNTFDIMERYNRNAEDFLDLDPFAVFNTVEESAPPADGDFSRMSLNEFVNRPDVVDFLAYDRPRLRELLDLRSDIKIGERFLGNILLLYTLQSSLPSVLDFLGRNPADAYPQLLMLLDKSANDASGITRIQNQPYLNLRGQGVMLGFVDTGIDYTKSAFRFEDGGSKISYIWDQTVLTGGDDMLFGRVYSREQINQALNSENPLEIVPQTDDIGHGTYIASVAGGRDEGEYLGAAPDAEIIAVKVRPARRFYMDRLNVTDTYGPVYQNTDVMAGIKFIIDKAAELSRPVALCIAMGTNLGPHDGSTEFENYISQLSGIVGGVCVTAAGNESNTNHHTAGTVAMGETKTVSIKCDRDGSSFTAGIWFNAYDKISVSLRSPTGEYIDRQPFQNGKTFSDRLIFENTMVTVSYNQNGRSSIFVSITDSIAGIWDITLYGDNIISGEYNAWLPITYPGAPAVEFTQPVPDSTVVIPATSLGSVTCGAYNSDDGSLYISSSWGPTLLPALSPDFVAPGVNVAGVSSFGETTVTGTSAAAAITTGAAALILEWGIVRGNDPTMNSENVRTLLISGCEREEGMEYPNNRYGFGKINVYNTFNNLRET